MFEKFDSVQGACSNCPKIQINESLSSRQGKAPVRRGPVFESACGSGPGKALVRNTHTHRGAGAKAPCSSLFLVLEHLAKMHRAVLCSFGTLDTDNKPYHISHKHKKWDRARDLEVQS